MDTSCSTIKFASDFPSFYSSKTFLLLNECVMTIGQGVFIKWCVLSHAVRSQSEMFHKDLNLVVWTFPITMKQFDCRISFGQNIVEWTRQILTTICPRVVM
jgi:hypothetical protein